MRIFVGDVADLTYWLEDADSITPIAKRLEVGEVVVVNDVKRASDDPSDVASEEARVEAVGQVPDLPALRRGLDVFALVAHEFVDDDLIAREHALSCGRRVRDLCGNQTVEPGRPARLKLDALSLGQDEVVLTDFWTRLSS